MGVSEKRQNFHFGVEYPFNYRSINQFVVFLQKIKEENERILQEYGYCVMDNHKERIGNFRIEPPGLFRGRGDHPKMGKLKRRIRSEDIIINCSKSVPEHSVFSIQLHAVEQGSQSLHSKVRIWILISVKRSEIIVITKLVFNKYAYNYIQQFNFIFANYHIHDVKSYLRLLSELLHTLLMYAQ